MDWSLVLVSQGIETSIERTPEGGQHLLVVHPADHDRAIAAIKQYERENRVRRWQQPIRWTGLLLDWRVVFCLLPLMAVFFVNDVAGAVDLRTPGIMDNAAVRHGEWWRLFTAVTLHADLGHLASNFVMGVLLLGLAMGTYGTGKALLASYLAGVGGNLGGLLLLSGPHRCLGASGMVLGALGLLTVQSLSLLRGSERQHALIGRAVAGGFLLLVLIGLNPHTDVMGHVGGFAVGAALGGVLVFLPEKWNRPAAVNRACGILCLVIVGAAWARALLPK